MIACTHNLYQNLRVCRGTQTYTVTTGLLTSTQLFYCTSSSTTTSVHYFRVAVRVRPILTLLVDLNLMSISTETVQMKLLDHTRRDGVRMQTERASSRCWGLDVCFWCAIAKPGMRSFYRAQLYY